MSTLRWLLTLLYRCFHVSHAGVVHRNLKRKEQPCNDQTQYTGLADLGSIGTSAGPLIDEPPTLDVHNDDCAFPEAKRRDSSVEVASAVKKHPMFMKLVQAHYACRKVVQQTIHEHQGRSLSLACASPSKLQQQR